MQSQQEQRPVHFNYAFSQAQRFVDVLLIHTNRPCIISMAMPHMKKCTPTSYVTPLDQRVWLESKRRASQYQMDDHAGSSRWNSGNVNCDCKSGC
jgi:hypothetical protein